MSEAKQLDENTIQKLQEIRPANEAIKACAEILNQHVANDGSVPADPRVFIRVNPAQEMGLIFAIEACANKIAGEMNSCFEDLGGHNAKVLDTPECPPQ